MHRSVPRALLLLGCLLLPGSLAGQVAGLPLRNAGLSRGLHLGAEIGFPNDALGLGTAVGATGGLGVGLLGFTATVARWGYPDLDGSTVAFGGTASLRLIGGPLVPFAATLQAGLSRQDVAVSVGADRQVTILPVGLGLALTIPSPVVSLKPWLAPRVQVTRTRVPGLAGTTSSTDLGMSGGVDLGFINGVSIRGAYDRLFTEGTDGSVWSLGLGYSIRILP